MLEKIPTIEKKEKESGGDIRFEAISELEEPIKKIIEKLKERIGSGDYGLIIGDDASGRIPTLILGGFIQEICDNKDLYRPNIIFIPGKLNKREESFWSKIKLEGNVAEKQHQELDEYLIGKGAVKERKILIVTDTLKTGESLKTLTELLRETGYNCDIATIGIEQPIIGHGIKENLMGIDIFSGEYRRNDSSDNRYTPRIYEKQWGNLGGVNKIPGDEKSRSNKSLKSSGSKKVIQESINQARKDVGVVIDHLLKWYELQK